MMVDDSIIAVQNAEPPDAETSRGPKLNQSAPGTVQDEWRANPHFAQHQGRVNGAVPCAIQTFMSDRQRLLRSWLALQGQAPAHIIADELVSTISALRQLVELRE
jgi:hypothetical protein